MGIYHQGIIFQAARCSHQFNIVTRFLSFPSSITTQILCNIKLYCDYFRNHNETITKTGFKLIRPFKVNSGGK